MGMITRVRGRLRSIHTIQKINPEIRDEKIAETGKINSKRLFKIINFLISVCLLSVLFLLPYCSRGHSPLLVSLGGWCVATYSFLVLPVLISANYKYPVKWLRKLFSKIPGKNIYFFKDNARYFKLQTIF